MFFQMYQINNIIISVSRKEHNVPCIGLWPKRGGRRKWGSRIWGVFSWGIYGWSASLKNIF